MPTDPVHIHRSRLLLPVDAPPVEDAAVAVRDGLVVATGRFREVSSAWSGTVTDHGDRILLPGLVNAHCHLDYGMLRGKIAPAPTFTRWIQRINSRKRELNAPDYLAAIRRGIQDAVAHGTAAMLNIEAFPELLPRIAPPPIPIVWSLELMNIRRDAPGSALLREELLEWRGLPAVAGRLGIGPHSPYTASTGLYREAAGFARRHALPFTSHLCESEDERQMFEDREGPLFQLLESLGRPMNDCDGRSAFVRLLEADALPEHSVLVHMNALSPLDLEWLGRSRSTKRFSIAHCPQSHAYFRHPPFPYREIRRRGANVCLGTDSLASSPSLSMFDEMRTFASSHPDTPPGEILAMATLHGAAALQMDRQLGSITPGKQARILAIPFNGAASMANETAIHFQGRPDWVLPMTPAKP